MRSSLISAFFLGSLAAQAAGKRSRGSLCKSLVTVTETVTVTGLPPQTTDTVPSSATSLSVAPTSPSPSQAQSSSRSSSATKVQTEEPEPTTTLVEQSSSSSAPSSSAESIAVSSSSSSIVSQVPASSASSANPVASQTSAAPYASATEVDVKVPATEQCGIDDRLHFTDMPWSLSNNMYNSESMVGTQCTNFVRALGASDGTNLVEWTSTTDVQKIEDTADVCKGYSNFGDGPDDKARLRDIKSIPAYFKWSRSVEGDFKGAHIFDMMTSVEKDVGEQPNTKEFMLFLKIWGGQRAMGWNDGAIDTLELFGHTFKLYYGVHSSSGQQVFSLEPDTPFEGEFQGNLKEWLDLMVEKGHVTDDEYLNHWTGGVEIFYGKSTLNATSNLSFVV
ncbi:unnamed protein product [Clonostachys rhizophaga]|uniref:Uncharacterized protein n=1 Tax=Clonostachys rhizophaga TaxID=160324 RepID=A0A9N9YSA0_9HYPO|nr:unnamed protein product [Clonostachys rhizophaga]